jgi:hypothetical protein
MQLPLQKLAGCYVGIIDGIDLKLTSRKNRNLKHFKTKYLDKYLDLRKKELKQFFDIV